MLYKNHLIVSNAIAVPIMSQTGTLSVSNVLALSLGALLPDIDEPESYLGSKVRGVSDLINLVFKHRGITHTLLFVFLIGFISIPVTKYYGYENIGIFLTLGVFLHVFEDSFSNSGVKWLLPFTKKTYHLSIYNTGSLVEYIIGLSALIGLFLGWKNDIFIIQKDEVLNIQNFIKLTNGIKNLILSVLLE